MKDITKATWQEDVLDHDLVLVDFWASWCAPCKTMLPILQQLEEDVATLQVVKVNADENTELVEQFDISSIPTMLLFKQGELVTTITGAKPRGAMLERITPFV